MDLFNLLERTLEDQMNVNGKGPGNLKQLLEKTADYLDIQCIKSAVDNVLEGIFSEDQDNDLRNLFGYYLAKFDSAELPSWSETKANSEERRSETLSKMKFSEVESQDINTLNPFFDKSKKTIVITDEYENWYPGKNRQPRFYWDHYSKLLETSGWPKTSILRLDEATDEIITRIDNPLRNDDKRKAARGLVVGYVQSGKTANFTGVTAKAIDAGYKMIIILGGTLNVLRSQTQRRLDKELLGKNNLMHSLQSHECPPDYEDDPGWSDFVEYKQKPNARIERLTDSIHDFTSDFSQKLVPMLTYDDREVRDVENLKTMPVKLMVVKKQKNVLEKLIRELRNVQRQIKDLPVIIIDDESDQASVNTAKITKSESDKRTTINKLIIELLEVFTAPQYIGYTATPAANVLINPVDARDLFPRDFIITLPRPIGYMGVSDFYDFDENWNDINPDGSDEMLNEKAYVRSIEGEDAEENNLPEAILSYILSGAIKLYRYANGISISIKHHTMLYHSSVKKADHDNARNEIFKVYRKLTASKAGLYALLKELYKKDFSKVSEYKCEFSNKISSPNFSELVGYIEKCIDKIECPNPVRVVNGDVKYQDQLPNFEKEDVWSILVGGAKLSRGYTVEGLTVSYFRRKAGAGDTLMQAGRWFGFRKNYKDLVRLFIGIKEKSGNKYKNLYLDFKDICRDEELFREELRTYTKMEDGQPIRPKDVLPTIPVHGLNPTAKNKMQSAKTHIKNLGGTFLHKAANISHNKKIRSENLILLKELIKSSRKATNFSAVVGSSKGEVPMLSIEASNESVLVFLKGLQWRIPNQLHEEISFIESDRINNEIKRWLVVFPTNSPQNIFWSISTPHKLGVYSRELDSATGKFKAITDPAHVSICKKLLGLDGVKKDVMLKEIEAVSNVAILLVYPVIPKEEVAKVVKGNEGNHIRLGLGVFFPKNKAPVDTYIVADSKAF